MNKCPSLLLSVSACLSYAVVANGDVTVIADSPRTTVVADTAYVVRTARYEGRGYPIETKPAFSFDCSQTSGWTVDAQNRVEKVPDLGGGARYLTSANDEVMTANYSLNLWYGSRVSAPVLMPAEEGIKGPYLDFGAPGSKQCLFFDPGLMVGDVAWNKLTNIGTVVGVYNSKKGSGQLLGGPHFRRYRSGEGDSYRGTNITEAILLTWKANYDRSCEAALNGDSIWTGRHKNIAKTANWNQGWDVVAYTAVNATTLESHGVGVGNCNDADYSITSGGQTIAELMVFDTVLPESDVEKLIAYLEDKWLDRTQAGENGEGRMAGLCVSDGSNGLSAGKTVEIDVPAGEALALDQVTGGRSDSLTALPTVAKTGDGKLVLNDAANFGGEVRMDAGTLTFEARKVPTDDELPIGMTFRLDASDETGMVVADGAISEWTNKLWATRAVRVYMPTAERRPRLVPDALGEGLSVVDFGSVTDGDWAYFNFNPSPNFATVFAVVDARIQAGGQLMNDYVRHKAVNLYRGYPFDAPFIGNDAIRSRSDVWVNGRHNDIETEGYEVPGWQVAAFRVPISTDNPYYLGACAVGSVNDAGGLRLGELIGYERTLNEDEIRDVSAYLMKKWLGRTLSGYSSPTDVADLQNVTAAAGVEIDVPAGEARTIARLKTTGAAVKTGAGTLLLGDGSDLSGGLVVRAGKVMHAPAPTVTDGEPAKEASLHLDACNPQTYYLVSSGGKKCVVNWQDASGRIAAYSNNGFDRVPYLNETDTLNGHPVIDFGDQVDGYSSSAGRFLTLSREICNVRAAYVVYGSQAKGGQIFGVRAQSFPTDFSRGNFAPTLDSPIFGGACENLAQGELCTNGVKFATAAEIRSVKPTGGYELVELHSAGGMRFNALATSCTYNYLFGGCRMGEVIVYERLLTEREKVATRNYLLSKWFPETPLAKLPDEPELQPIGGSLAYGDGYAWNMAVKPDGTTDDRIMAVTGTISFGAGSTINLTGLTAFAAEQLQDLKLVIAKAGAYEGLDSITITGDVAFTTDTAPRFVTRTNGDLVIRFGRKGMTLIFR